jgi:hypothetical protein
LRAAAHAHLDLIGFGAYGASAEVNARCATFQLKYDYWIFWIVCDKKFEIVVAVSVFSNVISVGILIVAHAKP